MWDSLDHALSIAFLIALSTFCAVVLNFLATSGYKVFVIEVKALLFKTVWIIASRDTDILPYEAEYLPHALNL